MFRRVLVANRGEIAVRIVRACRALGVATVAVHSDADASAPHVRLADQAVRLGPAAASESYLRQDRVLDAARSRGCDAVHPGYGFLSENAGFARACAKAGLVFVGPPPAAMEALGDKVRARILARKLGVPVAPGSAGALKDASEARKVAEEVGFPVILKAAAGGGGMGMRVARSAEELPALFEQAAEQARAAFGDGALFLERYLERPRHIEVQVLGDPQGQLVQLGERECSIQRRHQKLLEEAPSPALKPAEREHVHALAVKLAKAGGYTNAGTMEFLYQDGAFHFNEMNTRLQVEHPVTEMVTGIDLVQAQLRVAAGESLGFRQEDVHVRGHALECRINAEDPYHGFAPSPGKVARLGLPAGEGVRVDHALAEGWVVPSSYDSLVAKLIVHARDRPGALAKARAALDGFALEGFPSTLPFHRALLRDPAFEAAQVSTRFLETSELIPGLVASGKRRAALAAAGLAMAPRGGIGAWHAQQAGPAPRKEGT